jgi:hypothetical protein
MHCRVLGWGQGFDASVMDFDTPVDAGEDAHEREREGCHDHLHQSYFPFQQITAARWSMRRCFAGSNDRFSD